MAITFFGVASTPVDNGSSTGPGPIVITPPANMLPGDLVYVGAQYRGTFSAGLHDNTPRMFDANNVATEHGGQQWNWGGATRGANATVTPFWTRFSGTWSANPSFRVNAGTATESVYMLVFRPTSSTMHWVPNVGPRRGLLGTTSTGTIGSVTTVAKFSSNSHVAIASVHPVDDNTYAAVSSSGWSQTGLSTQYRNTGGTDHSAAFAYRIQTSSAGTGTVGFIQNALGPDNGSGLLTVFTEVDLPTGTGGSAGSGSLVQFATGDVETQGSAATIVAALSTAVTSGNTIIGYAHYECADVSSNWLINITDNQGGVYFPLRFVGDSALEQGAVLFFRTNITTAAVSTITIQVQNSMTFAFSILVGEFAGAWNYLSSAAVQHVALDAGNPETVSTFPQITPPTAGSLAFLGAHPSGFGQTSTFFTTTGSFSKIAEILGDGASRNNAAIFSFVQGPAAAIAGNAIMASGRDALAIMGVFTPVSSAAVDANRIRFPYEWDGVGGGMLGGNRVH